MSRWLAQLRRASGERALPMILQGQVGECGLAAMAMIAHYHGCQIGLAELRRRFLLSRQGTNLANLVAIAQALGLQARALRLEMDGVPDLQLPCIVHWDLNHFVVLKRAGARRLGSTIRPAGHVCSRRVNSLGIFPGSRWNSARPPISVRKLRHRQWHCPR